MTARSPKCIFSALLGLEEGVGGKGAANGPFPIIIVVIHPQMYIERQLLLHAPLPFHTLLAPLCASAPRVSLLFLWLRGNCRSNKSLRHIILISGLPPSTFTPLNRLCHHYLSLESWI